MNLRCEMEPRTKMMSYKEVESKISDMKSTEVKDWVYDHVKNKLVVDVILPSADEINTIFQDIADAVKVELI